MGVREVFLCCRTLMVYFYSELKCNLRSLDALQSFDRL